jgi:hypothetical protein
VTVHCVRITCWICLPLTADITYSTKWHWEGRRGDVVYTLRIISKSHVCPRISWALLEMIGFEQLWHLAAYCFPSDLHDNCRVPHIPVPQWHDLPHWLFDCLACCPALTTLTLGHSLPSLGRWVQLLPAYSISKYWFLPPNCARTHTPITFL